MDIGSLFLILALALAVGLFIARPFLNSSVNEASDRNIAFEAREHVRSALLAEREQVLDALQELDFDQALGKIPAEDFPFQRSRLLAQGAAVLRKLDEMEPPEAEASAEDRLEAAVAARRAETRAAVASANIGAGDAIEDQIALRRRAREEKSAGFCPKCGRPLQKSDRFCPKCGTAL
jgi:rubrerythrin